jgi:hypothetical protein
MSPRLVEIRAGRITVFAPHDLTADEARDAAALIARLPADRDRRLKVRDCELSGELPL